jgi:hypothetical protein
MKKMRYIMYIHYSMGGFDLKQAASLSEVRQLLRNVRRNSGDENVSASLYPWSEEDWSSALEYATIGCPFDYPWKVVESGKRGGVVISNA